MKYLCNISLLALMACYDTTPWNGTVDLDTPFDLPFAGTAYVSNDSLEVTFTDVLEESRCPMDVDCIWAGRAVIELEVIFPGGESTTITLGTVSMLTGQGFTLDTLGYRFTLHGVEPYPDSVDHPIPDADYVARLEVNYSWSLDDINVLDDDTYAFYSSRFTDYYDIGGVAISVDSLAVTVSYGGGCREHDFYLLGTCDWGDSYIPQMTALLVHDGHGDTCEAYLTETLMFDLSPLRACGYSGGILQISLQNDSTRVTFSL